MQNLLVFFEHLFSFGNFFLQPDNSEAGIFGGHGFGAGFERTLTSHEIRFSIKSDPKQCYTMIWIDEELWRIKS